MNIVFNIYTINNEYVRKINQTMDGVGLHFHFAIS